MHFSILNLSLYDYRTMAHSGIIVVLAQGTEVKGNLLLVKSLNLSWKRKESSTKCDTLKKSMLCTKVILFLKLPMFNQLGSHCWLLMTFSSFCFVSNKEIVTYYHLLTNAKDQEQVGDIRLTGLPVPNIYRGQMTCFLYACTCRNNLVIKEDTTNLVRRTSIHPRLEISHRSKQGPNILSKTETGKWSR